MQVTHPVERAVSRLRRMGPVRRLRRRATQSDIGHNRSEPSGQMRVLHVTQCVDAGVARVVVDLVTDQVARGWDVVVACPPRSWLPGAAETAGARVEPWWATRSPGPTVVREIRNLAALVRRLDPTVVHLHSTKAGLVGRLALRGRRPTAFQPHAWSYLAATGPMRWVSLRWEQLAARWTHLLVAVSHAEAARGRRAGIIAATVVRPNGIDVERWRPRDGARARAALGIADGPVVVCAGRLALQKGQHVLAAVWPRVRAHVPGARLILVGDGPARDRVTEAAGRGVHLVGFAEDPAPWYAAADLVVVPSRYEGMALVPLEAMACGRPVVATDVDGIRETLGHRADGIVPVDDEAALVDAIVRRLLDPALRQAEGSAGRRRAVERFDVRHCAAAVGDALSGLARHGTTGSLLVLPEPGRNLRPTARPVPEVVGAAAGAGWGPRP